MDGLKPPWIPPWLKEPDATRPFVPVPVGVGGVEGVFPRRSSHTQRYPGIPLVMIPGKLPRLPRDPRGALFSVTYV